ncbi:hypothetical protein LA080_006037 [Diaporthe eres]|nr:hypothetical protein LA080_006037 [Diaporthe eres]
MIRQWHRVAKTLARTRRAKEPINRAPQQAWQTTWRQSAEWWSQGPSRALFLVIGPDLRGRQMPLGIPQLHAASTANTSDAATLSPDFDFSSPCSSEIASHKSPFAGPRPWPSAPIRRPSPGSSQMLPARVHHDRDRHAHHGRVTDFENRLGVPVLDALRHACWSIPLNRQLTAEIPVAILDEFVPNIGTDNPSEKIIWKVVAAKCTYPYDLISLALSPGTEFLATSSRSDPTDHPNPLCERVARKAEYPQNED